LGLILGLKNTAPSPNIIKIWQSQTKKILLSFLLITLVMAGVFGLG